MAKLAIFHVFDVFESIWKPVKMLNAGFEKTLKCTKYVKTLYHLQFLYTHVFMSNVHFYTKKGGFESALVFFRQSVVFRPYKKCMFFGPKNTDFHFMIIVFFSVHI